MAEGARLESVYTATYRGFESPPHRHHSEKSLYASTGFFLLYSPDVGGMRIPDGGSTTGACQLDSGACDAARRVSEATKRQDSRFAWLQATRRARHRDVPGDINPPHRHHLYIGARLTAGHFYLSVIQPLLCHRTHNRKIPFRCNIAWAADRVLLPEILQGILFIH